MWQKEFCGFVSDGETEMTSIEERYRWFCTVGWKVPVLNHPLIIQGEATSEFVDQQIQQAMNEWPMESIVSNPLWVCPKEVA